VLRAARRFAVAYVAYDTGRLNGAVGRALEQSCTGRFRRELLAHVPVVPPGLGTRNPAEGVRAVDPLKHLPPGALVLVAVRRNLDGVHSTGAIELRLVETRGRWLIDALSVLS
jgi:hypothetical protein